MIVIVTARVIVMIKHQIKANLRYKSKRKKKACKIKKMIEK